MKLDFNPDNGLFWLSVARGEADVQALMRDYGLDLYAGSVGQREQILFTKQPYAAASFAHAATPTVRERLSYIMERIEASRAPSCDRHIEVPDDKELWPFQRASADYILSAGALHGLDADEPGLGKTPTAIAIANEMRADRVLVVCPASIRQQWCRRIEEWSTMGRKYKPRPAEAGVYAILSSQRGVHDSALWTVVSWDLVRSPGIWKALAKQEFDLLILDEAHYAKTIDARRTRAIFGGGRALSAVPLAERSRRVLALTGTPLPNRPREAYTLARHLCWESIDFASEEAFNDRFNPIKTGLSASGKMWADERTGRMPELQNRLRAHFMARHLKREVMTQLQMPVYDLIRVEETAAVKQALAAERLLDINPDDLTGADAATLGHIASARKQMGLAMAPQVVDWCKMLIDGGENKLVLFAWHIEVLDILQAGLHKYGCVRVDGRDSAKAKDHKVQQFIRSADVQVILGNVLSLGTGTDGLQSVANHCLLAEADWVFGNNQQCIDRLDRGGQLNKVQADIFVAPGSIAEKVLAAALRKGQVVERALDRRIA